MDSGVGIFLFAILIVGVMVLAVVLLTRKRERPLNRQKYQGRWLAIEAGLSRQDEASFSLSVLNADKLLDQALKERGFSGATMGERMKSAKHVWSNADHVWGAHKIRNKVAHEPDVRMTYEIAARSLAAFKTALKDLGAI